MKIVCHELKILPQYFDKVLDREKTFEIRKNDRDFQVGDIVKLKEWSKFLEKYTGRELLAEITYITNYEQKEGYVVFSTRILEDKRDV